MKKLIAKINTPEVRAIAGVVTATVLTNFAIVTLAKQIRENADNN